MTENRPSTLRPGTYTSEELANCAVVEAWFSRMTEGRIADAFALVDKDVFWRLPRADTPDYGHTRSRLIELSNEMSAAGDGTFPFHPLEMIAKDDMVCARARSDVRLSSGRVYKNQYSFWFELRDGLIVSAAEYLDTSHVKEVFDGIV